MEKFQSSIDVVDNQDGSRTLNYSIFLPGRLYSEAEVTLTQIDEYNGETNVMPGVKAEIKFADLGIGNPITLNGSIQIAASYILSDSKPFIEVVYKAWDNAVAMYKDKGGAITRKILG